MKIRLYASVHSGEFTVASSSNAETHILYRYSVFDEICSSVEVYRPHPIWIRCLKLKERKLTLLRAIFCSSSGQIMFSIQYTSLSLPSLLAQMYYFIIFHYFYQTKRKIIHIWIQRGIVLYCWLRKEILSLQAQVTTLLA